jgi:hypothetical protein
MALDWSNLASLTGNRQFVVTKVKLVDSQINIEGEFDLPPMAKLSYNDQIFVAEFIRAHGSIKHMEQAFGVSYPTIKNRLNGIAERLNLVQVQRDENVHDVLDQLERGEIDVQEAVERVKK